MDTVSQDTNDHNQVNAHSDVRDDPIIKQILARVANVEARQAAIELRQTDMEQGLTLMHGLVVQMHDRQEHLIGQSNIIVEWIRARGDTGALGS
jgi:hypothetical protein